MGDHEGLAGWGAFGADHQGERAAKNDGDDRENHELGPQRVNHGVSLIGGASSIATIMPPTTSTVTALTAITTRATSREAPERSEAIHTRHRHPPTVSLLCHWAALSRCVRPRRGRFLIRENRAVLSDAIGESEDFFTGFPFRRVRFVVEENS